MTHCLQMLCFLQCSAAEALHTHSRTLSSKQLHSYNYLKHIQTLGFCSQAHFQELL